MLRSTRTCKSVFLAVAALPPLLTVSGCNYGEWSHDEVARTVSPDGRIDAVLFEENSGATTSFDYTIDVAEHGKKQMRQIAEIYGAVRNGQAYGVNLKWVDNTSVQIEYLTSKTPPAISDVVAGNRRIKVIVKDGITDPAAPSGGMLYNLNQKHPG